MHKPQATAAKEVKLSKKDIIISTTDLKGRITYINDDFLRISGFHRHELIGEPHNMVRHNDMPKAAFKDMWKALKKGDIWEGYVKNLCKNKDFYWVKANMAPLLEDDKIVGYLSVRQAVTEQEIQEIEPIYRAMKKHGKMENKPTPLMDKLNILKKMSVKQQIISMVCTTVFLLLIPMLLAINTLHFTTKALVVSHMDNDVMLSAENINVLILKQKDALLERLVGSASESQTLARLEQHQADLQKNVAMIDGAKLAQHERLLANDFLQTLRSYETTIIHPSIRLLQANNAQALESLIQTRLLASHAIVSVMTTLQALTEDLSLSSDKDKESSLAQASMTDKITMLMIGLGLLFSGFLAWYIISELVRRLAYVSEKMDDVANGDFFNMIQLDKKDELGQMMHAIKAMQIRQGFSTMQIKQSGYDSMRVKQALDNVSSHVMISDEHHQIFYMNQSMGKMLTKHGQAFAADLPRLNLNDIQNHSVADFYQQPEICHAAMDRLKTSTVFEDLQVGEAIFRITATPVLSDSGRRLATVTEWQDRTEQEKVEQAVANFVQAASHGDFAEHIQIDSKEGFFFRLVEQLNGLNSNLSRIFTDIEHGLKKLEEGDLSYRIEYPYQGTFDTIKYTMNNTYDKLDTIINKELVPLWDATKSGDFSGKICDKNKTGFYADLVSTTNGVSQSLNAGFSDISSAFSALEAGNLKFRITNAHQGSFHDSKQAANHY